MCLKYLNDNKNTKKQKTQFKNGKKSSQKRITNGWEIPEETSLAIQETKIKSTLRFHLPQSQYPQSIKQVTAQAGKDSGKGDHLFMADKVQTYAATKETNVAIP